MLSGNLIYFLAKSININKLRNFSNATLDSKNFQKDIPKIKLCQTMAPPPPTPQKKVDQNSLQAPEEVIRLSTSSWWPALVAKFKATVIFFFFKYRTPRPRGGLDFHDSCDSHLLLITPSFTSEAQHFDKVLCFWSYQKSNLDTSLPLILAFDLIRSSSPDLTRG